MHRNTNKATKNRMHLQGIRLDSFSRPKFAKSYMGRRRPSYFSSTVPFVTSVQLAEHDTRKLNIAPSIPPVKVPSKRGSLARLPEVDPGQGFERLSNIISNWEIQCCLCIQALFLFFSLGLFYFYTSLCLRNRIGVYQH